ncbi:hypothetical protein [Curtobacterium sp. NPDC089689]|uniref:hypothetical protein n=1 Tax=Curtobacterium sp. NPDC089689 TaxID=3363968 RepID=UPI003804E442
MTDHQRAQPLRVVDASKLVQVAHSYYVEVRAKEQALQDLVADLNEAGVSVRTIAAGVGVSRSTAHDWIRLGRARHLEADDSIAEQAADA